MNIFVGDHIQELQIKIKEQYFFNEQTLHIVNLIPDIPGII
jgi:hypothetical protein